MKFFSGIGCFEGTFSLHDKNDSHSHTRHPQKDSKCTPGTPEEEARKTTKVRNDSAHRHGMDETSECAVSLFWFPK